MKKVKLLLCFLLTVVIAFSAFGCAKTEKELSSEAKLAHENAVSLVNWYKSEAGLSESDNPLSGAVGQKADANTDWLVINLKALEIAADYDAYKKTLENFVDAKAADEKPFFNMAPTDFQRIALAYFACGGDPNMVGASKTDIFSMATDFDKCDFQGVNSLSYGLISFNMSGKIKNAASTKFIQAILSRQNSSGGFAWFNDGSNPSDADLTGIVIMALAPYYGEDEYSYESKEIQEDGAPKKFVKTIKTAIDEMLLSLKPQMDKTGNIAGAWGANPSSTATVISALSSLNKDVYSYQDFIYKVDNKTVILFDGLALYKTDNGGYRYSYTDESSKADAFSAKDALTAFASYYKMVKEGKGVYQQLSKVTVVSVDCSNILNNLALLSPGYEKYVPENGVIISRMFVPIEKSKNVLESLKSATGSHSIKLDVSNGYISGINNIAEKCCGNSSGWLFKLNGLISNKGASSTSLSAGDTVEWGFTVVQGDI